MTTTQPFALAMTLTLALGAAAPAAAQRQRCPTLTGSLAATLQPPVGWVGQGALTIGRADPLVTILVDTPIWATMTEHGGYGEEVLTFSEFVPGATPQAPPVLTGSTIVMKVKFWGVLLPVPFLGTYHATGTITGTGIYADATGNVTIEGQAQMDRTTPPRVWPFTWMAQIHGAICGVR